MTSFVAAVGFWATRGLNKKSQ